MRVPTRLAAAGSASLLAMTLALTGCSATDPTGGSSASAGVQLTPTPTSAPKPADSARLPSQAGGWAPTTSPTMLPTDVDNVRVRVQTAIFHDAAGQDSRIVTLIISPDKGYGQAQHKDLTNQQIVGNAVCGVPEGVPNAVSCLVQLDGGMLQTTGTGQDVAGLANFTNDIYASFT